LVVVVVVVRGSGRKARPSLFCMSALTNIPEMSANGDTPFRKTKKYVCLTKGKISDDIKILCKSQEKSVCLTNAAGLNTPKRSRKICLSYERFFWGPRKKDLTLQVIFATMLPVQ
jgi:hypothetical protein